TQGNIVDFAPVDSVTFYQVTTMTSQVPTIVINQNYDTLFSGSPSPDRVRGVYPRLGSNVIYKLPFQVNYPPFDTITVCVKDFTANPRVIIMSVPLHRMDFDNNADEFLRYVVEVDFGVN
ncbi:MAG: hypothetical protein ACRDFC_00560, partial [Ignavibacteria bacterium]